MRAALTAVAVMLVAGLLTGMGNLGGVPEGTVPKVQENITAHFVDRSGVATDVTRFSMEGKVSFEGERGVGHLSILVRELKEVSFGKVSGDHVPADLLLKSGGRVQLKVPKSTVFYGDTGYGAYTISAGDVSRIVFAK